jgi:hypothetical protein
MKKMAILGTLILATFASAQVPPPNEIDGAARKCTITTVQTKSTLTRSPQLQTYLNALHPAGYNLDSPNHNFGDSFRVCLCEVCSATLEIRVKQTTQADIPDNDGYTVGVAPFGHGGQGSIIANGNVWPAGGGNAEKTITINFNPQQLTRLLCAGKDHWLDVYVQDDTIVKWTRLTTTHP